MAEEEPTTTEVAEEVAEEVAAPQPKFLEAAGNDKANLVLSLASAILFDGSADFTVCSFVCAGGLTWSCNYPRAQLRRS